jgi:hypothetical protein
MARSRGPVTIPHLSEKTFERMCDELCLSEAQHEIAKQWFDEYFSAVSGSCDRHNAATPGVHRLVAYEFYPEARPDTDISRLAPERQEEVRALRSRIAEGRYPYSRAPGYADRVNEELLKHHDDVVSEERSGRQELVGQMLGILAEEQLERLPGVLVRVDIAAHETQYMGVERPPLIRQQPVFRVDVQSLLDEATVDGQELEGIRELLVGPFTADAWRSDRDNEARTILAGLEANYARAVRAYQVAEDRRLRKYASYCNTGSEEKAERLLRAVRAAQRLIFRTREQYVEYIGEVAKERVGELPAEAWIDRYRGAVCPATYAEDSVDVVVAAVVSELPVEDERVAGVETTYADYMRRRSVLRERAYHARIEAFCNPVWRYDPEPAHVRKTEELKEIDRTRVELASEVRERMAGILGDSFREKIQEWVATYRRQLGSTPCIVP